jgi:uncharacterized membrane protein
VVAPTSDGDKSLDQLDDESDREELRQRYYGLMQELRVVLPGVQVLAAFLLTVPFAERFGELDRDATRAYGVALLSAILSVVAFVAPTAFHRLGDRRARSRRLAVAILLTRVGIGLLAVALTASTYVVGQFVFSDEAGVWMAGTVAAATVVLWFATPLRTYALRGHSRRVDDRPPATGDR